MACPLVEDELALTGVGRPALWGGPQRQIRPPDLGPASANPPVRCSAALAGHTGLVFDTGGLDNHVALGEHLHPVPVTLLPPLAKGPGGAEVSEEEIAGWLETAAPQFEGLLSQLVPK